MHDLHAGSRRAARALERKRIKAIAPLFCFGRFPNQDEIFYSLHDGESLGNQHDARTRS